MKLWCDCCDKVQPVEVTDERCAKTYAAYQDIMCTECHLVIASGNDIRRTWVGLTDEERRSLREWQKIQEELGPVWAPMMLYLYEAIEAKLREKNNG